MRRLVNALLPMIGLCVSVLAAAQTPPPPPDFIPEQDDVLLSYFRDKRYFAVIAVDKASVASADLPFAAVDATELTSLLSKLGYKPLAPTLTDKNADHDGLETILSLIPTMPPETEVIVYYSGHSVVSSDGRDLWLQLYGQKKYGAYQGMAFSDFMRRTRGGMYEGGLALVIDSCFSGAGTTLQTLSLGDIGPSTVIFSSSDGTESSRPITLDSGKLESAFTYAIIDGISNHWAEIDTDGDGLITYDELDIYTSNRLTDFYEHKRIEQPMHPKHVSNVVRVFAYDRSQVQHWKSPLRKYLIGRLAVAAAVTAEFRLDTSSAAPVTLKIDWSPTAKQIAAAATDQTAGRVVSDMIAGRYDAALTSLGDAGASHDDSLTDADIRALRAVALAGAGRYREASSGFQELVRGGVATLPRRGVIRNAATAAVLTHEYGTAEILFKQALAPGVDTKAAPLISKFAGDREHLALTANNLAALYAVQDRRDSAAQWYDIAMQAFDVPARKIDRATTEADLAELYRRGGRLPQAQTLFEESIATREKAGVSDERLLVDLERYSSVLAKTKDKKDKEKLDITRDKADALRERVGREFADRPDRKD